MSKKEKCCCALAEDFQAVTALVPKLESFIKIHNEIAVAYQKYRKGGGASIPGIEKHLGCKEEKCAPPVKEKKAVTPDVKVTEEGIEAKKSKKKVKK
jgi:hypothetical protein